MKFDIVSRRLSWFSAVLAYVGAFSLFVIMCLTTADVVGRYIFNRPITGVFELTEYLVLILIFSFIGYAQSRKSHVAVDLVIGKIPQKIKVLIDIGNHAVCLILMILITWMGVEKAFELRAVGEASPNLQIPAYPFAFFLVLGCVVMCIELIRDIMGFIADRQGGEKR